MYITVSYIFRLNSQETKCKFIGVFKSVYYIITALHSQECYKWIILLVYFFIFTYVNQIFIGNFVTEPKTLNTCIGMKE